jgi:hypothetical protein
MYSGTILAPGYLASASRVRLLSIVLLAIVLAWAAFFVTGAAVESGSHGIDFLAFYQGAYADTHGVSPYHPENTWFIDRLSLFPAYHGPAARMFYLDPPTLLVLIRPLTWLPEPDAYLIWAITLVIALAGGTYLSLNRWHTVHRLQAAVLATISPVGLFALNLGQTAILVCFGLNTACFLLARKRPFLAGVALSMGLLKPQLLVPLAAILILATVHKDRRPLSLGLISGVAAQVALTSLADNGFIRFAQWWEQIRYFSNALPGQLDMASVSGWYYPYVSPMPQHVLNLACILAAILITGYLAWSARATVDWRCERLLYGGVAAWLTFLPYEHTSDQVLLLAPLFVLIGEDLGGLRWPLAGLAALAFVLVPMRVVFDFHTGGVQAIAPGLVLLAYVLRPASHQEKRQTS